MSFWVSPPHRVSTKPYCPNPKCRALLDGAAGVQTYMAPEPGNFSICCYCGVTTIYTEDLQLRFLTQAEMQIFESDLSMVTARSEMLQRIATHPRKPPRVHE